MDYKIINKYIGIRYKNRSFIKEEGLDCLTFILLFFKEQFNITLVKDVPEYSQEWFKDDHFNKIYTDGITKHATVLKPFTSEKELKEFDILFFSYYDSPDRITHAGIYLGSNKIIHCIFKHGVVISKLDTLRSKLLLYTRELR